MNLNKADIKNVNYPVDTHQVRSAKVFTRED